MSSRGGHCTGQEVKYVQAACQVVVEVAVVCRRNCQWKLAATELPCPTGAGGASSANESGGTCCCCPAAASGAGQLACRPPAHPSKAGDEGGHCRAYGICTHSQLLPHAAYPSLYLWLLPASNFIETSCITAKLVAFLDGMRFWVAVGVSQQSTAVTFKALLLTPTCPVCRRCSSRSC